MTATRDARKVKGFKPDRTYHWVRAQQLFSTQGGASGDVLHGAFLAYHPNGQLKEAGRFKEGTKQGEWRAWNERGELIRVTRWRNGKERTVRGTEEVQRRSVRARSERVKTERVTKEVKERRSQRTDAMDVRKRKATTTDREDRKERKPERQR
jgi:hypothetical protein